MEANTLTFKELFLKQVRYQIPIYQRPYVWKQNAQWEPLWEDIRNTAERYVDELQASGDVTTAQRKTATHFLGAVVLQQKPTAVAEIDTRFVIDGQQRLMTVQLMLAAAREVFRSVGAGPEAERLSQLLSNLYASGDDIFKLWPSNLDRDSFQSVVHGSPTDTDYEGSKVLLAYDFFRLQIEEWLRSESTDKQARRIHGLETAILGLIELVVIDVESADDAFAIFETLNARGTPLLASDLVKNYVLQSAMVDSELLYQEQWQAFEDDWWREEVRQGRIVRPRLDIFLNYWLVMKNAEEVQSHEVFSAFKSYVQRSQDPIDGIAADLRRTGDLYHELEQVDPYSRFGRFLYRWRTIDIRTITPVILWLIEHSDEVEESDRLLAMEMIESFLVRRMICRKTTRDYNRLFLELLSRLHRATPSEVTTTISSYLANQTSESRRWPTDSDLEDAVLSLPLYRLLTRSRLRMVLEAIEDHLRSSFAEDDQVKHGTLTIEHILPRRWKDNWPLQGVEDEEVAIKDRERLLHSLGNLTLVNGRLNPKLSNAGWIVKRNTLDKHTVLHMNKRLLKDYWEADWDEESISSRGKEVAGAVKEIWPITDLAEG